MHLISSLRKSISVRPLSILSPNCGPTAPNCCRSPAQPSSTSIITAHTPYCCSHFCCLQLLPKQRDFDLLSVFPSLAVTLEWRHSSLAVGRHIDECHTTANSIGNYWSLNVLCLTCGSENCLFVAHFPAFVPGTCPCFVPLLGDPTSTYL